MPDVQTTIGGSASRQPVAPDHVPFSKVPPLQGPGAPQKSHVIPQQATKNNSDLFRLLRNAELPNGELPFDPNNWMDNGQPLPSNNLDTGGKAIIDSAQHIGSHPIVNDLADDRLDAIYTELTRKLDGANDPTIRNAALAEANAKVRNLADTLAAISVGGVIDPEHPELRAVYNRADPNAKILWPDWDTLSDAEKNSRISGNLDNLVGRFLEADGSLTQQGADKLKVLRDLTGGKVGAVLTSADAQLADRIIADMAARRIDPQKVNAMTYADEYLERIVPEGGELAERARKLATFNDWVKIVGVLGGDVLLKAVGGLLDGYDYADTGGRLVAAGRGDASFNPTFDESQHFSGVDYMADLATKTPASGFLGTIPLPQEVLAGVAGEAAIRAAILDYIRGAYLLPEGLVFELNFVTVDTNEKYISSQYRIDDKSTPFAEHVDVIWANPVNGGGPRGAAMVLRRAGANDDILIVQDVQAGTAHAFADPSRLLQRQFTEAVTETDPVVRAEKIAALKDSTRRSVEVEVVDGKVDPSSAERAVELINNTDLSDIGIVEPENLITVTSGNPDKGLVTVVIDGVVHVVRGAVHEIERFLNALAKGPGIVLEDLRNFGKSGAGLIDFADVGQILGSQLSQTLPIHDPWARMGASSVIGAILTNVGQSLDLVGSTTADGGEMAIGQAIDGAFTDFGEDVLQAGTGAVSSYLVGNLLAELGVQGDTLEAAVAFAGPTIGKIAFNGMTGAVWNDGLTSGLYANAAASFLGSKLADKIVSFDSVSGQIGAAVGQAVGSVVAAKLFSASLATGNPYAILAGAVVVAVTKIVGGLIGSLFGPSTSSATIVYDDEQQRFRVDEVGSKRGGSKEAARSLSGTVADTFNAVLEASGSKLLAPIEEQRFGMRNKKYVYWNPPSGYDAASRSEDYLQIVNFGLKAGLDQMVGKLGGGDVFVKRMLVGALASQTVQSFDVGGILGDFSIARDYGRYLSNRTSINSLIAAQPDSAFSAGWITTLAHASELGIDRRAATDWTGGWNIFLDEMNDGAIDGSSWSVGRVSLEYRTARNTRLFGFTDLDGAVNAYIADTVDNLAKSEVVGTAGADQITIFGDQLQAGAASIRQADGTLVSVNQTRRIAVSAIVDAGQGNDTVLGGELGNDIFGGEGNDTLYGGRLDDWLLGGDGDDRLDAGSATPGTLGGDGNYLDGGAGNDRLFGREGSDWLEGGEGTDVLRSGGGGDILSGGAGDGDELYGGAGDDSYLLRRGDGADLADDQDAAAPAAPSSPEFADAIAERFARIRGGSLKRDWLGTTAAVSAGQAAGREDAIAFGYGISINDVRLSRSVDGKDLIVEITEIGEDGTEVLTGDKLTVRGWFSDPFKRVEWLKFVDGTEIRIGDVTSFIVGTSGDDVLIGTDGNDFVYGGSGNDKLYLLAGNDIGLGGTGDDLVSGGADDDLVVGGLGNDRLIGGSGNDALTGDGGHDSLYGSQGSDILSGGRGNDVVVGGAGNDRFKFARGDGHDTLFDDYSDDWTVVWKAGNWLNGYTYDPATSEVIAPDGTYVRKNFGTVEEPDLRWVGQFDYDDTTGELRQFTPPVGAATTVSDKGEDTIEFALDINVQDVMFERVAGTDDLRVVIGRANAETSLAAVADSITLFDWYDNPGSIETFAFYAAGEIDVTATGYNLIGGSDGVEGTEANPLRGTAGKDWMTGAGGDDFLAGGAGDDIVSGGAGSDHLKGEAGNDVLYGGSGNDILDGGLGADILSGGAGLDTASYASAANAVTVYLTNSALNQGDAKGDVYDSIEKLIGSGAGDVLGGDEGDNELTGGKGNDSLLGGLGNDTYRWNIGDGADTIEDIAFVAETIISASGEIASGYTVTWQAITSKKYDLRLTSASGEEVYSAIVNIGTGSNAQPHPRLWPKQGWQLGFQPASDGSVSRVVHDTEVDSGDADAIEMGAGISLADLAFDRIGDDLKISYVLVEDGNNGDGLALGQSVGANLLVRNHFLQDSEGNYNNRVEYLIFADGLAISLANILTAGSSSVVDGGDLDELIVGQRGVRDDVLSGGSGDDVLSGGDGNDTLRGGDGDDVLEGGKGADVLDGGAHSIPSADGSDSTGLHWGDTVRYATSATGVSVDLASSGPQAGGDAQGDTLIGIENVTGSAFDDTLSGDENGNRLDGLGGNNTLYGRGGDDVLVSGDGADLLDGGAGDDNLSSGAGDDVLRGGAGNDLLAAGDGDDQLFGDEGDDILSASAGNDRLEGATGNDQLIGGEGDDALLGGAGEDVLVGEGGNDSLAGGADADRYFFAAGFGEDVLIDSEGANEILIDQSIAYDALWFHRSGDDLVMTVRGSDDRLTISDFFAPTNAASIYSVQTATHRLFLGHPDVRNFLVAMQAASPGGVPDTIPASVAALMSRYWHEGTTARPYAEDFDLAIDEDTMTGPVAIGAIDHDENISEYRIIGDALHGTATVDANGRFAYAPDLNFNGSDSFKVAVLDADGNGREIEVRVAIAPVDDAPVIDGPADGPLVIDEDAPLSDTVTGSVVGRILASEFDGEAIVFTLTDNAGGRFAISVDGIVTVADASRLDHEANESHTITVLVTDAVGSTDEQTFTIAVNDVNEAPATPVLISQAAFIGEGSLGGIVVASFALSDPEDTVPTLVADGNPGNLFEIVGGEVRLAAEVDFETLAGYGFAIGDEDGGGRADIAVSLTVHADDGELRSDDADTITFFVEDVNEAPSALLTSGLLASFAERDRVPMGTTLPAITLAVLSVTDPDLGGLANARYTYTIDDPRFEVIGNQLRLRQGVAFDYESEDQVTVTVTATDQGVDPLSILRELTFAIENRDDYLEGTPNADTLIGQANRDIIAGLSGNDHIEGLSGDDTLVGNDGKDTILGGAGNDEILGGADDDLLYGEAGNDTIMGGSGHDVIAGGLGSDTIDAGEGDDEVLGDDDGVIDTIDGGSGVDRLVYATLSRAVIADLSAEIADGDSVTNIEEIEGSAFADALTGDAGDNRLLGGAGDDVLSGLVGSDRLEGGAGNDTLSGGDGNDLLFGGDGDDVLAGDAGSDSLFGDDGSDNLSGGAGDDRLEGGRGNDVMDAGDGNDTYVIDRKSDHDTIFNYDGTGSDIDVLGFSDTFGEIHEHDLWFERQGDDLVVFVIGEDTSVRVTDWYLAVDPEGRANHRLDFLLGGEWVSRETDVEALAEFQSNFTRPTSPAELDALRADPVYDATVATFFGINAPPAITGIADQSILEDGTMQLVLTLGDDYTPAAGIAFTGSVISGASMLGPQGLVVGAVGADGKVTVTLAPAAHVAGTIDLSFTATDAGGVDATQTLRLTIDPVADTPLITQFSSTPATSGAAIALSLAVEFPDRDGSETQTVRIAGVPSDLSLNRGSFDAASGQWVLQPADLSGLSLLAPAGWSQDLQLTATAHASEGGTSAQASASTTVVINAPPTNIVSGLSVDENATVGTGIGYLQGVDPDGDALTYELLDDADGRFTLDPDGFLKVGDGLKLDYEAATAHAIRVRVTDPLGATYERSVSVGVRNVNEAPSVSGDTSRAIFAEPVAAGTVLATFAASDPDGTTPVLELTSGTNLFAVSGSNIVLKSGAPTTYADALAYANARGISAGDIDGDGYADVKLGTIEVVASDGSLESGVIRRDVYFENISDAPNAPSVLLSVLHSETGDGLTPHANKLVAKFSLSDPDGAQPTLVITGGNDNGWFRVAGDSIVFAPDVNLTPDYLRAIAGTMGVAASFSSDIDSDGLKELLVANLTLAARDADGLLSQSVSYAVRIEDRNESPQFGLASYAYGIAETVGAYTQVGTAAATDVDGPVSALTYGFVGGSTRWDAQLGANVGVSADGRLLVHGSTGAIYAATAGAFGSAGGQAFDYSLSVTDRNGDSHALTATAGLHIDVSGVNEPHTLIDASDSRDEVEGLEPLTPIFDLRSAMLQDPEGRNMRWQFAGGGTQSADGLWTITSDGKLVLTTGSADYESIITYYETRIVFNPKTFEEEEVTTAYRDPSRATQELEIEAVDDSIEVTATAVFTATITNVDEAPVLIRTSKVSKGSGEVVKLSNTVFAIENDTTEGNIVTMAFDDPDTLGPDQNFSYRIENLVKTKYNVTSGGHSGIGHYDPLIAIDSSTGTISFSVSGDGEWEGGIKLADGGKETLDYHYDFDVVVREAGGAESVVHFTLIFGRNGKEFGPVVLDLDGDGIEFVSLYDSDVYKDLDGDGIADHTGWVSPGDGILVLDRDGSGLIDKPDEMTFISDLEGAQSDMEGLVAFDSNGNGLFEAGDNRFAEFRIWIDLDQNGVSEAGELHTFADLGLESLSLATILTGDKPGDWKDNGIYATGSYTRTDGSTGIAGDTWLYYEPSQDVDLAAPVILDFDGDGETLVGLSASKTAFDQDGDGDKERTAWFEADDAVLAIDRNKNGAIDDISEISFLSDLEGAKTDLEGLAAYDQNKDGRIDASDIDFAALKLWFDKDSDGVTDAGELRSLSEVGIASISLEATQDETTGKQADGSVIYGKATFVSDDGRTGTLLDTGLAYIANSATHATAIAGAPVEDPEFAATHHSFGRKSKKYYAHSLGGELAISLRKAEGEVDRRAGGVGVFSEMRFANSEYAYLDAIVLDLDGDGIETKRHSKTKARFDMNGDGVGDDTGWSSSRDGLLVVDRNENGLIDDGSELSFQLDAPEARSAMQGLAAFDSNGDGVVSVLDERFGELKIWVDSNHDGKTDAGELCSLAEHYISSISIRAATSEDRQKVGRNVLLSTAIFNRADGSAGTLGNVAFGFKPSHRSPSSGNDTGNGFAGRAAFLSGLPRIEDLSFADTLHDDSVARFDKGLQDLPLTRISQEKLELEAGGPGQSVQDLPLIKVRAIDALDLETTSDLEGPAKAAYGADAQRLALLLQDMAAFGAGAGAHDQLRDRQPEHALADIYS